MYQRSVSRPSTPASWSTALPYLVEGIVLDVRIPERHGQAACRSMRHPGVCEEGLDDRVQPMAMLRSAAR